MRRLISRARVGGCVRSRRPLGFGQAAPVTASYTLLQAARPRLFSFSPSTPATASTSDAIADGILSQPPPIPGDPTADGTLSRPTSAVVLRDYQEECIQAVLKSIDNGQKRLGISLATGSGKTVVFTQLIDRIKPVSETATRTLVLAHRKELVEQAAKHCVKAHPHMSVDIEMAASHASGRADVTIASLASIASKDRLDKYDPTQYKLVLVDEAHHIVSPSYMKVLRHMNLEEKRPDSPNLIGVSATFSRFDGLRLGVAIDEIVYHRDYMDMIEGKWLANVIFTTVKSSADLSEVRRVPGSLDFDLTELSRAVNTNATNDLVVRSWIAKASSRTSTLVFCVDINHVRAITEKFRDHGFEAHYIIGDSPTAKRSEILNAFKRGEFPVLVNCGVFTEGTDIPNIDCILLARPTNSRNLLVQMIGRGMRLHPGKENCHVIDYVASLKTGVITTPTLFGLDPDEVVSNATAEDMKKLAAKQESFGVGSDGQEKRDELRMAWRAQILEQHKIKGITVTDYNSVYDLIYDGSGDEHIRTLSQNSWVQVGPERFILSANTDGSFLRIEWDPKNEEEPYSGWEVRALPGKDVKTKARHMRPRFLLSATTLSDAVHGMDKYVAHNFPLQFTRKSAPWRTRPATDGQLKFLNKMRGEDEKLRPEDMTKGKAADMITKVKYGAKGQFSKIQIMQRQIDRKVASQAKLEAKKMEMNLPVQVGPILS